MDVEAEVDRKLLCDKILTQIDVAQAKVAMNQTMPNAFSPAVQAISGQDKAAAQA